MCYFDHLVSSNMLRTFPKPYFTVPESNSFAHLTTPTVRLPFLIDFLFVHSMFAHIGRRKARERSTLAAIADALKIYDSGNSKSIQESSRNKELKNKAKYQEECLGEMRQMIGELRRAQSNYPD